MYELLTLNDAQVLAIIGTHPEGFFEAMKEFEPYTLIRAGATRLEIKLNSSYVDLEKLKATFERLDSLGYHSEAHNVTYTKPNGEQVIDLGSITIDWKRDKMKTNSEEIRPKTISDLLEDFAEEANQYYKDLKENIVGIAALVSDIKKDVDKILIKCNVKK